MPFPASISLVLQFYCISICIFMKTAVSNFDILHHLWRHMFNYLNRGSNRGYQVCGVFLRFDSSRKISYIRAFHSFEGISNLAILHRAPKMNFLQFRSNKIGLLKIVKFVLQIRRIMITLPVQLITLPLIFQIYSTSTQAIR